MTTLAYLRVSKATQEIKNQRLAILEFARAERMEVHEFLELQASSRRSATTRKLDLLLARLAPGDTLMVSELSRLGRSVGEIITTVDTLVKHQIRVFALKEGFRLTGTHDLQTTVIVTLFGLFAEIERTLLSLRTKEALAAVKAAGKRLGRPRGTLGEIQTGREKGGDSRRCWRSRSPRRLSRKSRAWTAQRSTILYVHVDFYRSDAVRAVDRRSVGFCSVTAGTPMSKKLDFHHRVVFLNCRDERG